MGLFANCLRGLRVLQRRVVAGHRRAERAPADAVARLVQAAERALQACHARAANFRRGISQSVERQPGGHGSAQRPLAVHVVGFETWRVFFHQEAANLFVFAFGPDHRDVRDRAAGDPHLLAVQNVAVALFHRARQHAAGIRAELRLGQAEAADGFARLQQRQPFVFLRVRAVGVNRIHHQRALHGNEAAQAGIAALQFLRDQSVRDVRHARAAVAVKIRAKKSQLAQLGNQVLGESAFAAVLFDDGDDLVVDELAGRLAHQFFFVVQLRIKIDVIHSAKSGHAALPVRAAVGRTLHASAKFPEIFQKGGDVGNLSCLRYGHQCNKAVRRAATAHDSWPGLNSRFLTRLERRRDSE